MFDETLLDSSPRRAAVLTRKDWFVSLVVGGLGFLVTFHAIPLIIGPQTIRCLLVLSGAAAFGLTLTTLTLCYVYEDAPRARLRRWFWFATVCLLSVVGFFIYLVYSAASTGHWRRATIPAAYVLQAMLGGVLVLIPLVDTEALSKSVLGGPVRLFAPAPPAGPPAGPPAATVRTARRKGLQNLMNVQIVIPRNIPQIEDLARPSLEDSSERSIFTVPWGVPEGVGTGVLNALSSGPGWHTAPPASDAIHAEKPIRIRKGGEVQAAKLIFQFKPEYPILAKMARIQGTVRLEAIISKEGTIQNLRLISGPPLLVRAALEAVARWPLSTYAVEWRTGRGGNGNRRHVHLGGLVSRSGSHGGFAS